MQGKYYQEKCAVSWMKALWEGYSKGFLKQLSQSLKMFIH